MIDKLKMQSMARSYGVELTMSQLDMLDLYAQILLKWNETTNLTAITNVDDIMIKHFLDSMLITKYIPLSGKLVDVGTGAGFPGVVLKICRPDIQLFLMDSIAKKIDFLQYLCQKIDIEAQYLNMRAEDACRFGDYRAAFDCSTARAVAQLNVLIEYCSPLLKVGGVFIAMKGAEAAQEIEMAGNCLSQLNVRIDRHEVCELPDGSKRCSIIVSKLRDTPEGFPRRASAIAKRPL